MNAYALGLLIIYALSAHMCLAPFYLATEKRQQRLLVQNTISTFFFVFPVWHTWHLASLSLRLVSEAGWYKSGESLKSGYNFLSAEVQSNPYFLLLGSVDPQTCVCSVII